MTKRSLLSALLIVFGFILCLLVIADRYHFWSPKMAVEPLYHNRQQMTVFV